MFELLKDIPTSRLFYLKVLLFLSGSELLLRKDYKDYKINNSNDLAMYLLYEANVALVPGAAFGDDNCIRFSYATSDNLLIEAVRRIKEALLNLK